MAGKLRIAYDVVRASSEVITCMSYNGRVSILIKINEYNEIILNMKIMLCNAVCIYIHIPYHAYMHKIIRCDWFCL